MKFDIPQRKIEYTPPKTPYLDIIETNDDFIVCNKQSGLLSVPGRAENMQDCLASRLLNEFGEIYTIHRLDLETSGLIIYARHKEAQRALSQLFMDKKVEKHYIADIYGRPDIEAGEISAPLICDWPNRPRQIIDHENGKAAQTSWNITEKCEAHCRVKLMPKTGRSHQLRVHMQSINCPILGDSLYAHDQAFNITDRLHLHASFLKFKNPINNQDAQYSSPCPF